jgi:CRP-like cAMP-binding protein/N-acyl-L-homoserine lactone synthetase
MGVRIKLAETARELDELFQVRHRVFVQERRDLLPVEDGRLLDRFDAFPTTANIVALSDGHVVGGVRIVEPSKSGTPADALFDFRPHLPEGAVAGNGSMLVVDEPLRQVPRVTFAMLGMMYYWALRKGLTHITDVASPEAAQLLLDSGYKAVAPTFTHGPSQRPALPLVLDMADLDARFTAFVDKHQFRHFLQSFERQFHQAGEHIIRRGEAGTAAFVIIEGRVGVSVGGPPAAPASTAEPASAQAPSSRAPVSVREMGPGEVFGELALITAQPRSADIVALTDVDLMVLEREAFHRQVSENPEVAISLLSVIGTRLTSVTDRLGEGMDAK